MALRHFEAITCKSDGGFCVASSALTGNTWDGALWYFDGWEHYQLVPNMDMYGVSTMDGVADIKWYNDTSLLVGLDNGCVEVWSLVAPGNELENVNTLDLRHDEMVLCISVTSDGENSSYILSGGGDGRINVCDLKSEKSVKSFQGHVGWVTSLDNDSTQSNVFVSVGMDAAMRIWDIRQSKCVQNIAPGNLSLHGNFQSVSWSQNFIVTGSETGYVTLYDSRKLNCSLVVIKPHTHSVHQVLLSQIPKGIIVSASDDCSIQVYDTNTSQFVHRDAFSHTDFVRGLTWENDMFLLSCGWDGKIRRHCVKDWLDSNTTTKTVDNVNDEREKENRFVYKETHSHSVEDGTKMEVTDYNMTTMNGLNRNNIALENK